MLAIGAGAHLNEVQGRLSEARVSREVLEPGLERSGNSQCVKEEGYESIRYSKFISYRGRSTVHRRIDCLDSVTCGLYERAFARCHDNHRRTGPCFDSDSGNPSSCGGPNSSAYGDLDASSNGCFRVQGEPDQFFIWHIRNCSSIAGRSHPVGGLAFPWCGDGPL